MGITLSQVVPWGRSLHEYRRMFDLGDWVDREKGDRPILDCAGGPASFNAELTQQGFSVISCDPIYQFSAAEISRRIAETYDAIVQGVAANPENYVWQDVSSPAELGQVRMAAMNAFLADFSEGLNQGRYRAVGLPHLPFADRQFDLALCSHFLFSYSDHLGLSFHRQAIAELCRIAAEVRVFPLLKISGERSPFVEAIQTDLTAQGFQVFVETVPYEFQRGGNQLLRICSNG
jgi:hypothetical protein